jgi:hypothetical protein
MRGWCPTRHGITHPSKAGIILEHEPGRQNLCVVQAGVSHLFGEFFELFLLDRSTFRMIGVGLHFAPTMPSEQAAGWLHGNIMPRVFHQRRMDGRNSQDASLDCLLYWERNSRFFSMVIDAFHRPPHVFLHKPTWVRILSQSRKTVLRLMPKIPAARSVSKPC